MARPLPAPAPAAPRLSFWPKATYGFGDVLIAIRVSSFRFYRLPFFYNRRCAPCAMAGGAMSQTRRMAFVGLAGLGNGGWMVFPLALTGDVIVSDHLLS